MRGTVCVGIVLGLCRPALAEESVIVAPWAGSLIVTARAESGSPEPIGAAKLTNASLEVDKPASEADKPPPEAHQTIVPQIVPPNKKRTVLTGYASYYDFGRITANGERFLPLGFTAAHRTLPFGTKLLVTNKKTGKSVVVRINDRGPFIRGRAIDLTRGAARVIGLEGTGVANVTMEIQ